VTYLVMNGSIDATMVKRCVSKLDVIDQALDRELKAVELPEQQSSSAQRYQPRGGPSCGSQTAD